MVKRGALAMVVCYVVLNFYSRSYENKIVFCDVGQGSATFIQIGTTQLLIDTGPNRSVLACLGEHMRYFDRTIEYVVISHPQKDHDGGLIPVLSTYRVHMLISQKKYPSATRSILVQDPAMHITMHGLHVYVERASLKPKSINESAYVVYVETGKENIFISSDINGSQFASLIPPHTTIFTAPHHGSRSGLYSNSIRLAHPRLCVISVGKRNTYGHPDKRTLDILKAKNIEIWRTDRNGDFILRL
jgi:competence protein ComEC